MVSDMIYDSITSASLRFLQLGFTYHPAYQVHGANNCLLCWHDNHHIGANFAKLWGSQIKHILFEVTRGMDYWKCHVKIHVY